MAEDCGGIGRVFRDWDRRLRRRVLRPRQTRPRVGPDDQQSERTRNDRFEGHPGRIRNLSRGVTRVGLGIGQVSVSGRFDF